MTSSPPPELQEQAQAWASVTFGVGHTVVGLRTMPGHAGLTYGLEVQSPDGDIVASVILRLPPKGVKRQGNTDVLRQVPLLRALARHGLPVAPIVDASEDEAIFGVPYLVVARLPGQNVSIDDGGEEPAASHYLQAAEALGRLHAFPALSELGGWDTVRTYRDEVLAWDRALDKCSAQGWHPDAAQVREALLAVAPTDASVGLVHGDYQFSNLLFLGDELTAILDWEIASLGPTVADLGWLLVINDQDSWAHPVHVSQRPSDAAMTAAYQDGAGRQVSADEVAFAKALAAYRFAIIAGLNLHLHRTGRRVDAHWEVLEPSIPILLDRATRVLPQPGE